MSALVKDRDTTQLGESPIPSQVALPAAASSHGYAGGICCTNSTGYATPGAVATTLKAVGCYEAEVDNSAGSNGDKTAVARRGVFPMDIGSSADALTIADRFANVYIIDDHTVGKTDGTGTRSIAGVLQDVVGTQAFVLIGAGVTY